MKKIILMTLIILNLNLFADMVRPVDGSSLNYTHVLFEWDQEVNAWGNENDPIEYEIQISTNSNFSSILSSAFTSSLIYVESENINWSDTYYWRVRPTYNDGSVGTWIDSFSFNTTDSITSADITIYDSNEYQDGITFLGSLDGNFSAAFNKQGDEIWNSNGTSLIMYNTNLMGELYGCHYEPQLEHSYPAVEFDLDINYIWEEPNDDFSHHDIIRLPDGNYLSIIETEENHPVPSTGPWYQQCLAFLGPNLCDGNNFPWVGDKLVIWDKETKQVLWEWNAFDHYSIEDHDGVYYYGDAIYGGTWDNAIQLFQYDWTHINAVTYSEEENALYISCRHLSRVTKIYFDDSNYNNPQNGEVIWNIGQEMPSGDIDCGMDINFSWQHTISPLDNGNFVILDNGNLSNDFDDSLSSPITRALEINPNEIDGGGCNAEIVWEYSLSPSLFGLASGGVQKLDNGNYLISTVADGGTTLEVSSNQDLIWEAKYNLNVGLIHRAYRASSLYPVEVSAVALNYNYADGECCGGFIETSLSDSVRVWFHIYNNGTMTEHFEYSFSSTSSSDIWYEEQGGVVEVQAGDYQLVGFSGVGSGPDSYNDVELIVSSINNHNVVKTYNYTVVEKDDLSNEDIGINSFGLLDIYPNPFNPSTTINIQIDKIVTNAEINIYDINGKFIDQIYSGVFSPGTHSIIWNPKNISSGKYFIKFQSGEFIMVKEALYIK
tara:strand:- start:10885 stop:13035 length:2151 start_codon:yes stop_codon:yes gene_type:complete